MTPDIDSITAVIIRVGGIPGVEPDEDIYDAGVSSVDALQLLLELESSFNVSIPDDQFIAARTPRALVGLVGSLDGGAA